MLGTELVWWEDEFCVDDECCVEEPLCCGAEWCGWEEVAAGLDGRVVDEAGLFGWLEGAAESWEGSGSPGLCGVAGAWAVEAVGGEGVG